MTAEEIREAEERQEVLMQAFPSARYDVLPTTVDDGPPVVRGVPPPMVGTKPGQINTAYAARDVPGETPEEQKERAAALYAQQLADSGGAPDAGGSLSAPPGALVDPRALALQFNPLEELERVRAMKLPDHTEAGKRMQDEQGNFLGLQKQPGFSREAQIARARELYGQIPNERESRWEDEFLQDRKRYTDKDIQRSFMIQSLLHGQEHGMKFREMARGEQADYDKGLQSARQADAARQRVSPALAEAIAGAGLASPEAAVELRMNDPLVKAFTSGGYAQGLSAERIQAGREKNTENNATKLEINDQNNKANAENVYVRGMLGVQAALANRGIQATGDGTLNPVTQYQEATALMQGALGQVDQEFAARAVGGDYSELNDDQKVIAQQLMAFLPTILNDPAAKRQAMVSFTKMLSEAKQKRENAVMQSIELARNDVDHRDKWQQDWTSSAEQLKNAVDAWTSMTQEGKEAFVQWGKQGFAGPIGARLFSGALADDFAKAGAVEMAVNGYIKANAGSAVTGSEWDRLAASMGIATGTWAPFNSTAKLENFLYLTGTQLSAHRELFEQNYGGWEIPALQGRQ